MGILFIFTHCLCYYLLNAQKLNIKEDIILSTNPEPITFIDPKAVIRLTPWDFQKYSTIEIEFETREPEGLIFFVASTRDTTDSIGLEIFNRGIYIFGKLFGKDFRGKINQNNQATSDGRPHKVTISVINQILMSIYDGYISTNKFATPSVFDFDTYSYIGGIDVSSRLPFSAYVEVGFAGCFKYVRVNNNQFINLKEHSAQISGLRPGVCIATPPRCVSNMCAPGKCEERSYNLYNPTYTYYCDCSGTSKSYRVNEPDVTRGAQCSIEASIFKCDGKSFVLYHFEKQVSEHLDKISIDFRTTNPNEALFIMRKGESNTFTTFIKSELRNGLMSITLKLVDNPDRKYIFNLVLTNLAFNDNQWHNLKILRVADYVNVTVDENYNKEGFLFKSTNEGKFFNLVKEIYLGSMDRQLNDKKCTGQFRNFLWNKNNLLTHRNMKDKYHSHLMSLVPKLPVLPPFPREPAQPCSVTYDHEITIVNRVPLTPTTGIFLIELKTNYDGIIWHAVNQDKAEDQLTLLIVQNNIVLLYNILGHSNVIKIGLTLLGLNIKDNSWHRIIVELNKMKSTITIYIDNSKDAIKSMQLPVSTNSLKVINSMKFYIGRINEIKDYLIFMVRFQKLCPEFGNYFKERRHLDYVGCIGEMLINTGNFSINLLTSGSVYSKPSNSFICRACEKVAKCPINEFCLNNGRCYNSDPLTVSCNCTGTGYHGSTCDIKNPTCDSKTCQNGGSCQLTNPSIIFCNCSGTGYTGPQCDISNCIGYACRNGGKCKINNARGGVPECDCSRTNHTGQYCQLEKCPSSFCKNGGICQLRPVTQFPYCRCEGTGYKGFQCKNPICPPKYCGAYGRCVVIKDKPICICDDKYSGSKCDVPICPLNYCLNGGTCSVVNGKPFCVCPSNYEGDRCQNKKTCPPGYCLYGSSCKMVNGAPVCDCSKINYIGKRCESPVTCPSNYCLNGGKCSVVDKKMVCDCSKTNGFTGSRCDSRNSPGCPTDYCQNKGSCRKDPNTGALSCDCSSTGYSGPRCSDKTPGILCPSLKPGYTIKLYDPVNMSPGLSISMGFQTWFPSGTIFCYEMIDYKYWSVKLINGYLAIDIDGLQANMRTKVNDGVYHILKVNRNAINFIVNIDDKETISVPLAVTKLTKFANDILAYKSLTFCNSCPITQSANSFSGTLGGFNENGNSISDEIDKGKKGTFVIGPVNKLNVPILPFVKPVFEVCNLRFCKNGGKCYLYHNLRRCDCGIKGFHGRICDMPTYIIKSVPPKPGYVIHPGVPSYSQEFTLWRFLSNFNKESSPLAMFQLDRNNYIEFKIINSTMYLFGNGKMLAPLSVDPINVNMTYNFKLQQVLGHIALFTNNKLQKSFKLPNKYLQPNQTLKVTQVVIGANKGFTETITGFAGGFKFNDYRLIVNGSIRSPAKTVGNVLITLLFPLKIPNLNRILNSTGSKGGMVHTIDGQIINDLGYGYGAIVPSGALAVASLALTGRSTNVFLLLCCILLLITAFMWALFHLLSCCVGNAAAGGIVGSKAGLIKAKDEQQLLLKSPVKEDMQQTVLGNTLSQPKFSSPPQANGFNTTMSSNVKVGNGSNAFVSASGGLGGDGGVSSFGTGAGGRFDGIFGAGVGTGGGFGGGNSYMGGANLAATLATGRVPRTPIEGAFKNDFRSLNYNMNLSNNFMTNQIEDSQQYKLEKQNYAQSLSANNNNNNKFGPNLDIAMENNSEALQMSDGRGGGGGGGKFESEMKVEDCILSKNNKYAVTASITGPPQIWDLKTGSLIKTMNGDDIPCTDFVLAVNDSLLAGLSIINIQNPTLKILNLWDFVSGQSLDIGDDPFICTAMALSKDGMNLIIANISDQSNISLLDLTTNATNLVQCQIFYNLPNEIVAQSPNATVQLLLVTDNLRYVVAGVTVNDPEASLSASPGHMNNNESVSQTNYYMVFDMFNDDFQTDPLLIDFSGSLNCCVLINDTEAVNGTSNGELIVWQLATAQPVRQILISATVEKRIETKLKPHDRKISCLAISNDKTILISGSADNRVKLWNLDDETMMNSLEGHYDEIKSVALSDDKEILVTGSWDGSIRVWGGIRPDSAIDQLASFVSNIEITRVLLSPDKSVVVALGEREGVNKLIMLKIMRSKNVTHKTGQLTSVM